MSHSLSSLLDSARKLADAAAWKELEALLEPHAGTSPVDAALALLYAETLIRRGEDRKALDFLAVVESSLREGDDQAAWRRAVNMKGAAHWSLGDLDAAAADYALAVDLAHQSGDLLALAKATNNLGALANVRGQFEEALWHYRLTLPMLQRLGQRVGLAEAYHNMGHSFRDLRQLDEADEHEQRAIEIAGEGGAVRVVAMGMVGRAEIALLRDDARFAETTAAFAAQEFSRLGEAFNEADAHRVTGVARGELASFDGALDAFAKALELATSRGHSLNEAEALRDRARVYARRGERDRARADVERGSELFDKLGAAAESARLRRLLD